MLTRVNLPASTPVVLRRIVNGSEAEVAPLTKHSENVESGGGSKVDITGNRGWVSGSNISNGPSSDSRGPTPGTNQPIMTTGIRIYT